MDSLIGRVIDGSFNLQIFFEIHLVLRVYSFLYCLKASLCYCVIRRHRK